MVKPDCNHLNLNQKLKLFWKTGAGRGDRVFGVGGECWYVFYMPESTDCVPATARMDANWQH